jgi:glycosyltransferase involved in cell wall biosynthesis
MKIGFDGKRIFHNFRGLGNYSRNLVEGIMEFSPENEVFIFTPPFNDERAINWVKNHQNGNIISPKSKFFEKFPSIWRSLFLSHEIKKMDLDIYHGLSHELPFFVNQLRCKKVVTVHDLIFKRYPSFFSLIDRTIYSIKYSYSCRNADLIIAICEQTKKDLIDLMGVPSRKIEVAYQSCNPIFNKQLTNEERSSIRVKYKLPENYILFVGALEPNKNALNLVKAFENLKSKDLFLVLVGKGKSYKEQILKEIALGGIKEKVIFYDYIPTEDLPGIYQLAKLFVFPSFFEGFGIPIIEALFSRTPVITTKGHCFPESGGPSTLYVDTSDPMEISSAIKRVLENSDLAKGMVEGGFEYVQKFCPEKTNKKLIEIYNSLKSI